MRIELLGTSFSVRTDEDPEYFQEVVAHFRSKIEEIQRSVSTSDPLKVAILAGILATDEFMKLTGEQRRDQTEVRAIADTLIGELEAALDQAEADRGSHPPDEEYGDRATGGEIL